MVGEGWGISRFLVNTSALADDKKRRRAEAPAFQRLYLFIERVFID